ncbi:MAG TPA: hypothetical protein VIB00_05875 [Pyrinomonadaceae bacterium]
MSKLKFRFSFVLAIGIIVSQCVTASAQRSVVGYWQTGGVGMINEVNTVTGQTKNNRGKTFSYKFATDGTYTFVGYMESTMFGCTTSLFNEINGRYLVDGTTIFLNPSRDFWKNTYSCFPTSNRSQTKPPTKKSLEFGFKTDEYGKEFICLNDAGVETCYRREEE